MTLSPENADFVMTIVNTCGLSVAGVVNAVLDEARKSANPATGLPDWATHLAIQEGLPLDDVA